MNAIRKMLITGGAGYIGSVLTAEALRAGHHVRALDNLRFGGESLLAFRDHPRFELHISSLLDQRKLDAAVTGVDAVVHLAAIVGDPACAADPELAKAVNGEGSLRLWRACGRRNVERFVFASTCSNYGRMAQDDGWVDESSPLNPVSLYAQLKVDFERELLGDGSDAPTGTVLRFATAYGLSPRPRFDLTVNEFSRELALGRKLDVFGEQFWRPYCHTHDLARACLMVIEAPTEIIARQAFNVGDSGENYQKKTLVGMILDVCPEASELVSWVSNDEDPRNYRVKFDKIRDALGFQIEHTVAGGIKEIVDAVRSGLIADPLSAAYRNV
ncbi:MAG: NAD(P)-dependent oxidoreductase [bacterium]